MKGSERGQIFTPPNARKFGLVIGLSSLRRRKDVTSWDCLGAKTNAQQAHLLAELMRIEQVQTAVWHIQCQCRHSATRFVRKGTRNPPRLQPLSPRWGEGSRSAWDRIEQSTQRCVTIIRNAQESLLHANLPASAFQELRDDVSVHVSQAKMAALIFKR
jgi:hypothetical protein